MWFDDMSKVNSSLAAARECVCYSYGAFAWVVEMHKLESDDETKEFANNVLAKFKEHKLEPTELAKNELQSFTIFDTVEGKTVNDEGSQLKDEVHTSVKSTEEL